MQRLLIASIIVLIICITVLLIKPFIKSHIYKWILVSTSVIASIIVAMTVYYNRTNKVIVLSNTMIIAKVPIENNKNINQSLIEPISLKVEQPNKNTEIIEDDF